MKMLSICNFQNLIFDLDPKSQRGHAGCFHPHIQALTHCYTQKRDASSKRENALDNHNGSYRLRSPFACACAHGEPKPVPKLLQPEDERVSSLTSFLPVHQPSVRGCRG